MADQPSPEPSRSAGDTLYQLVKDFALPLAVVAVPLLYQGMAARQSSIETKARLEREQAEQKFQLYTSLLSKREEADSSVRRGLFDKLIGTYLQPNTKDLGKRMVALELLALNFHDSLNLSPLFWEQHREVALLQEDRRRKDLEEQLGRVAKQVKDRQAARLEGDGFRGTMDVDLDRLFDGASPMSKSFSASQIQGSDVQSRNGKRDFTLSALKHDARNRRLWVMIDTEGVERIGFWVDPYDFPLVNFSRISRTERLAVILDSYDPDNGKARLVFLYFPSSRSAAKDTPYIDDLLITLLRPSGAAGAAGTANTASAAAPPK